MSEIYVKPIPLFAFPIPSLAAYLSWKIAPLLLIAGL